MVQSNGQGNGTQPWIWLTILAFVSSSFLYGTADRATDTVFLFILASAVSVLSVNSLRKKERFELPLFLIPVLALALFALGSLYRDRLENSEKAVASLEELLKRYPETQYRLDALYYLYLAHTDLGNTSDAKRYYDMLVADYPNTNIVRALLDPDFLKKNLDKEHQLNVYYDDAYADFNNGNFQSAYEDDFPMF